MASWLMRHWSLRLREVQPANQYWRNCSPSRRICPSPVLPWSICRFGINNDRARCRTGAPLGATTTPATDSSTWVLNAALRATYRPLWAASSALGVPVALASARYSRPPLRRWRRNAALGHQCRGGLGRILFEQPPAWALLDSKERDLLPFAKERYFDGNYLNFNVNLPSADVYNSGADGISNLAVPAAIAARLLLAAAPLALNFGGRPGENPGSRGFDLGDDAGRLLLARVRKLSGAGKSAPPRGTVARLDHKAVTARPVVTRRQPWLRPTACS